MASYPAAIVLAVFSILVILAVAPPMWWHLRNGNIGAASVIVWIIIMNSMTFINAVIWPNDDFDGYLGQGLCDIEVKLQVASQVAFSASFACVLRALAIVMDTKRIAMGRTKMQIRADIAIDLLWCYGAPALQMLFHYIVQTNRYYLFGVSGCVPGVSNSWVTVLLILVPPVLWVAICAIYAIIILVRLYRYRRSFQQMLMNHGTNKSRFLRLLLLCILWIFGNVPLQCWVFSVSFGVPRIPFDWNDVHSPEAWSTIVTIPSLGQVLYDRYIWLASGILMFLFFGFGTEALRMYRHALKAMGVLSLVPHRFQQSRKESIGATGSRDRIVGNKASHVSSGDSDYTMSTATAVDKTVDINLAELEGEKSKMCPGHSMC